MEFWGVEVKAGESLKVQPDHDQVIHISQASLGESKKGKGVDSVPLHVKFGDQKLVLGTLSSEKFPQISFDLVFEKEFELSHNWSGGSVYFLGYKSVIGDEDDHSDFDSEESEEDVPMQSGANGSIEAAPVPAAAIKAKASKKSEEIDEYDSDSEDDSAEGSDDDDEVMSDDSDEGDDSEEDEETPKKPVVVGKKRLNEAAAKTPDNKKAKLATPSKTDAKKEVHTATPHPKKQGKASAGAKTQSPKSGGSVSCKSCSKTFNSDGGLQSHNKAKHSGGK